MITLKESIKAASSWSNGPLKLVYFNLFSKLLKQMLQMSAEERERKYPKLNMKMDLQYH